MSDLKTTYLGIPLKSPIIVGASNFVTNTDAVKKLEAAGAGAIVYKSLFEEQIQLESLQLHEDMTEYNERNAEMISLFPSIEHAGPKEHLDNLKKVKDSVSIPVIASLNCIYKESWEEYAQLIEKTGVDALELNFYATPDKMDRDGNSIEATQLEALKTVINAVKIPVSVKLSPFYSNVLNVVQQMDTAGAAGFVMFNRLFQPEIDLREEKHYTPLHLSNEQEDYRLPLRYAGLLYGNIKGSICSNTGIYQAEQVLKAILAGANSVQVVSTIYKNGFTQISNIHSGIEKWMNEKGYNSLNDFRGKLSRNSLNDPITYRRAQYIDVLMHSEDIYKRYPLR
ncbi:MAG: dihydroorotate dehydrogenase-like protein [Bacteroidota bacterium]